MTAKYFIPLQEIYRAIEINSYLDPKALKALTLVKEGSTKNNGIARSVFIFVALKTGYEKEVICDYLAISGGEYDTKVAILDKLYKTGKYFFTNRISLPEPDGAALLFYRKLLLATNYLRYKYGFVI